MNDFANSQLEAIRSMMTSGHRCIRVERHSLILWGITGGILCIATDLIIRPENFSTPGRYMTAWLIFEIIVLSGVFIVDFSITRNRKKNRGETFPFIQAQITKAWCLFIVMGVLFTFGSGFFGGSYMIFGVWLFLIGLGLFIHGLFSDQILEWAGVAIILLGVVPLILKANYEFTKLLAASVFAIGHPALCLLLNDEKPSGMVRRFSRFFVWLVSVVIPAMIAWHYLNTFYEPKVRFTETVPLNSFLHRKSMDTSQVVSLPSGTNVPVRIRISGNLFRNIDALMPLTLTRPVEVSLADGKPTGYFRISGDKWRYYKYSISIWGNEPLDVGLTPRDGPTARAGILINVEN